MANSLLLKIQLFDVPNHKSSIVTGHRTGANTSHTSDYFFLFMQIFVIQQTDFRLLDSVHINGCVNYDELIASVNFIKNSIALSNMVVDPPKK